nr:NBS-LRR disease resistance protein [Dasypyrum villosum]
MADAALSAAQWVVGKALAPVADGVLEAWAATSNFGLNIEALRIELLRVQATLEQAARKDTCGTAMEELLQRLRDSAHNAEDLLDELDYFRIHDELHGTHHAADKLHGRSGIHGLALNACHAVKAVGKHLASLPAYWFAANAADPRQQDATQSANFLFGCRRKMLRDDSSSKPNANQADEEVSAKCPKLGKLFPDGSSFPHPHVRAGDDRGNAQETPVPEFNKVEFSQRMKAIVEKLQPVLKDVNEILQDCDPRIVLDIAQHRPTTTPQSAEPKLYGRDHVMNSIIHDITEGQYCDRGLTVLPVVGPGGMGKTTLIQHIYNNQQVQNHFPVRIWICVSFSFHLGKVLEEIKKYTPNVEGEKECTRPEELIVQRLKFKRFLLVLDDIWQFTDVDDWKKLLLILGKSQENGSMILVTTRHKKIADHVKKTEEPKELDGLEPGEFRKLLLIHVFDAEQYPEDKSHLLHIGDKIIERLKGSPLAAKTVGRLLRTNQEMGHWRRVLKSKEWETVNNGIMSALKLSYDFLPFNLQRCFFYSALFPEDYHFRSHELISLWIGLDILTPCGQNPTFEDGLRNLNDLVIHGFFREEETGGDPRYVMHDLLHELALKVASHDCLSLRLPNVGSVKVQPTTRHLSISTENLDEYDAVSAENIRSELEKLKTTLNVEHLQTLMLFGKIDEGFVKIFGDFFGEANALRVLHFPSMLCPVESMLHNFSGLVHLRYLCLGTHNIQMHLPLNISRFYHLRILDLELWKGSHDLPKEMSNLAKLCHFYTPSDGELHSDICNVGKLKLLEELKVFRVNKREEEFEPKQLEHLTKLRELGIYNLEKIHTGEEAAQAKLMEKQYLRRLTLVWDSKRSSIEPGVEATVLESLQPHEDLEGLCIRGHGGPSCPTWLGDDFAVEALQSLWLDGVSWKVFPSLGKALDLRELRLQDITGLKELILKSFCKLRKLELRRLECFEKWGFLAEQESSLVRDLLPPDAHMFPFLQVLIIMSCPKLLGFPFSNRIVSPDWFPKLQELEICDCPEFLLVIPMSWIESLCHVSIQRVKLLEELKYSKSSDGGKLEIVGNGDLCSLVQVLDFDEETCFENLTLKRCPPLELKHLLMLTSLKKLIVKRSEGLVGRLGGEGDVEWQLPIEYIWIDGLSGNSGKELTELLPHFPKLSKLVISDCKNIKKLVVGVDVQQTTSEASEDDGVLLFPAHLCDSLRDLFILNCRELVLVNPPTVVPRGGWLQALRSLHTLIIRCSPRFLSTFSFFPSSLQLLDLKGVKGMGTLEPLSNLSSLNTLRLDDCGEDLKCHGLQSLLTTSGLCWLKVEGSPRFFAGWDPNSRQALEDIEGGEEKHTQLVSSTLQKLCTDDVAGLLVAPVCSFLSSSLIELELLGDWCEGMEQFSKEQEDALQLLSTLRELQFSKFDDLEQLPAGLGKLTSLKIFRVYYCPEVLSFPNDALPDSLEMLDVCGCSEELKEKCTGLVGTIPNISIIDE